MWSASKSHFGLDRMKTNQDETEVQMQLFWFLLFLFFLHTLSFFLALFLIHLMHAYKTFFLSPSLHTFSNQLHLTSNISEQDITSTFIKHWWIYMSCTDILFLFQTKLHPSDLSSLRLSDNVLTSFTFSPAPVVPQDSTGSLYTTKAPPKMLHRKVSHSFL